MSLRVLGYLLRPVSPTAREDSKFLLLVYTQDAGVAFVPSKRVVPSLAAMLTDPEDWNARWVIPDPDKEKGPLATLRDHDATVQFTLRIMRAWVTKDALELDRCTQQAVRHCVDRPALLRRNLCEAKWLIPFTLSAHRCLMVTHAVMAASLYGWAPSRASEVAELAAPIIAMLDTTMSWIGALAPELLDEWLAARLECVAELLYVYLLLAGADVLAVDHQTALMHARHLIDAVLRLACAEVPIFLPE
jgi:hypothetical protein